MSDATWCLPPKRGSVIVVLCTVFVGASFWVAWGVANSAPIRLVNGSSRCAGRLEVLWKQKWGTVCDDGWDLSAAAVVCRQLDCGEALSAPGSAHFGQGTGAIWLDDVTCTEIKKPVKLRLVNGSSRCAGRLEVLYSQHWGTVCDDSWDINDAQVVCQQLWDCSICSLLRLAELFPVRLVNGWNGCSGRVEVLHEQQWGSVCDDSWDLTDAQVVCRQLGCGTAVSAPGSARFGQGSGQIWLDDVNCTGTETVLAQCEAKAWGDHNCNHGEDAAVVCS
ncbi:PREDICTED: deleted in malignant brain tumors 1 protein-like, partial [Tauraco erythrolophus]|uniref:deleted in malignant brain tumors 1 protein-like n=1 Tax=Tauraco erythrolophus TaxID=121530 RepID=UPI0005236E44